MSFSLPHRLRSHSHSGTGAGATSASDAASRPSTSHPAASPFNMGDLLPRRRGRRILVVDDQPSIAGLMSQLLTIRGYDVVTCSSAEQAEVEGRRQLPDLILSDVMMPGKSGYEFCRTLKDDP